LNQKIAMKKSDLWNIDDEDEQTGQESQKRRDEFIKKPKNLELKQPKQEEQQSKEQYRNEEQQRRNVLNKNAQEPTHRFEAKPQRTKTHQRPANNNNNNNNNTNNNRNESKSALNSQHSNQQETKYGGQVVEEAQGGEQTEKPKTFEEIKRERRWKNDNKAKTVHHNRKELAANKMSQGFH
jgi:hypothetical protein